MGPPARAQPCAPRGRTALFLPNVSTSPGPGLSASEKPLRLLFLPIRLVLKWVRMSRLTAASAPGVTSLRGRLRVLHVVPYFPPSQAGGGIREAASCLARAQAAAGCRVTVLTTDVGSPGRRRPATADPGIEILAFRNLSNTLAWNDVTLPLGIRAWATRNAAAFDAVHLHGHRHLAAVLIARARAPLPYVLSTHGTALRIERREGLKRLFDRFAGDRTLHGAKHIFAVSEIEEKQLLSLGVPAAKIRRVANPVDPSRILPLPDPERFRRRNGIPAGARVILFLGRMTPNKRVDTLLRAVAPINNAFLILAGPDGGAMRALEREARAPALAGRVSFTGPLDDPARREALAAADILALPSEHEIFGIAPMEGLLAGAVPVVSAGTGCAERIQSWDAGFVAPSGDPDALRLAIVRALDEGEAGRERARRGARGVREELSPEAVAGQTIEIYREAGVEGGISA